MGSVRARRENGLLFLDFRYQGQRCREQTMLADTPANRKRLEKALHAIEQEIAADTFDYEKRFPGSKP
jgi:integrase